MDQNHGLIIDLSKYRPNLSLQAFLDAGADGFILRIGGPTQWTEGNWRYAEDPSYRPYMDQAKALGIQHKIGGYFIHNPFEDWRLENNVHVDLLNQWTGGGYMPGYFIIDHEVAKCWRGTQEIVCTPFNLVSSLAATSAAVYAKWRKMCVIYTARWFINAYGQSEHTTYLDNVNKPEGQGGAGKQRPMWYAWYVNNAHWGTTEYSDLRQAVTDLPTPTGTQIGAYLQCGSYSLADLWQFTDRLRLAGQAQAADASVTFGTLAEYWAAVGVTDTTPPTDPPPADDPPPSGDVVTRAEFDALKTRMDAVEGKLAAVKAAL